MSAGVAVVVGAGGRLGAAVARRLLDAGLDVVGIGRDADAIRTALDAGGRVTAHAGDISRDEVVDVIAAATAGRVVTVAVNAARPAPSGSLADLPAGAIASAVDVKAGGLLRLVRGVDASLRAGSRLVALGGRLGSEPDPRMCAAGIANAAVANLVRQLADAYAPRGVTAHVVAPGAVAGADRLGGTLAGDGRLPTPDDVAWAVETLTHPAAAHLSGTAIVLSGPAGGHPPG